MCDRCCTGCTARIWPSGLLPARNSSTRTHCAGLCGAQALSRPGLCRPACGMWASPQRRVQPRGHVTGSRAACRSEPHLPPVSPRSLRPRRPRRPRRARRRATTPWRAPSRLARPATSRRVGHSPSAPARAPARPWDSTRPRPLTDFGPAASPPPLTRATALARLSPPLSPPRLQAERRSTLSLLLGPTRLQAERFSLGLLPLCRSPSASPHLFTRLGLPTSLHLPTTPAWPRPPVCCV